MTATCPKCDGREHEPAGTGSHPITGRTIEMLRCVDCGRSFYV